MLVSTAGPGVGESEELGDEEYNKPGEVDDNSRGVYSRGKKHFDGRSSYKISEATIHWKR